MWNRNFLLLFQGQVVSQLGSHLFSLALLYWVLETTGSATLMGLVLMAASLPGALLAPFGGTLADRIDRKVLLVGADVIRGLAALAFVAVLLGSPQPWHLPVLIAAQIVSGLSAAAFRPAMSAAVPDLVPKARLAAANSLLQGTGSVTALVGMGAGGFLYALLGAPILFAVNGVSYLLSALSECFLRLPPPAVAAARSGGLIRGFLRDTADGLRHISRTAGLPVLLGLLALVNFVLPPTSIALPILVRDFLGEGPEFLGLAGAAQSAGAVAGFLFTALVRFPLRLRARIVAGALIADGLLVALVGNVHVQGVVLAALALFGFLLPVINVTIITVLQTTTEPSMRGRVFGVATALAAGLVPISQGLAGLIIDLVDQQVPLIYAGVGMVVVTAALAALASRSWRAFMAESPDRAA